MKRILIGACNGGRWFAAWTRAAAVAATFCASPAAGQARMPQVTMGFKNTPQPLACTFREGFHAPGQPRSTQEGRYWTALKAGTPVRLRFADTVSSKRVAAGGAVALEVLEEIKVNGLPVILKNAEAWAVLQKGTRRPGMHWEWRRYDDRDIPALFGHGGEFPILRTGGELHFQVQGAFDLTGEKFRSMWRPSHRGRMPIPGIRAPRQLDCRHCSSQKASSAQSPKAWEQSPSGHFSRH